MKQQRNIKGEMWKGGRKKRVGEGEKEKKLRKGHLYLGEHHLSKLQWSAIKRLKIPNCWVTTATKNLIKAVSRAAVDGKCGEAPGEETTEGKLRKRETKLEFKVKSRYNTN